MLDSYGSLTPAALIPFCAYQTNMTLLGQTRQDLPFTVCDKFQPTVLEGQLCYTLNLGILNTDKTKSGLDSELLVILDASSFQREFTNHVETSKVQGTLSLKPSSNDGSSARIYMNTLSSFIDYRSGSYGMSVLKKMTGTEMFLNLPDSAKKCQIETFEDCHALRYIKEVIKVCGCVPWGLSRALQSLGVIM